MKLKKIIVVVSFLFLGLENAQAQAAISASGGEATGSGGTSSFTIGQTLYATDSSGNVAQGVQQAFEIYIVGIEDVSLKIDLSVYPNPTINYLNLKVEKIEDFNFELMDMQGKTIESKEVKSLMTNIDLEHLPASTYLLKITNNNLPVKTFKIIKR